MTQTTALGPPAQVRRAGLLVLLFLAELAGLALVYQVMVDFQCSATGAAGLCGFLASMVARAIVVLAMAGLLVWARPVDFGRFLAQAQRHRNRAARAVHLIGIALLFLPLGIAFGPQGLRFELALGPWLFGAGLASVAGLLWLAPVAAWRALGTGLGQVATLCLILAFVLPDLVGLLGPIWDIEALTGLTFAAVGAILAATGAAVTIDPATYIIGVEGFVVRIASQCSGIEGAVLVLSFGLLYAMLFRRDLRLGRFLAVVLPLAIAASWLLNILRIALLILIGARVSPDLAVNGFHSHAGWLFFSAVALGLVWLAEQSAWLHRTPLPARRPWLDDPTAALILPFAAFMLASLATHALYQPADLGYPLRVAVLVAVVWLFRRAWRRWDWALDPVGIGVGTGVGILWLALADPVAGGDLAQALLALPGVTLGLWIALRLVGTVLLVPLVEEAFFRGYVLARLDRGGTAGRMLALAVSTALFALLHGQWLAAGVAGLAFGLVMLRRGRVGDAVQAHMAANLLVGLWALLTQDFALI